MSLLRDFLIEAANTPYNWEWSKFCKPYNPVAARRIDLGKPPSNSYSNIDYDADFWADNAAPGIAPHKPKPGLGYVVSFYCNSSMRLPRKQRTVWDADWGLEPSSFFKLRSAGFDISSRYDLTKTGDSFRIMATVIDIFKEFIKIETPGEITFSAKEPSRRQLYGRLVSMASVHIPGYHGGGDNGSYYIRKRGWEPEPDMDGPEEDAREREDVYD